MVIKFHAFIGLNKEKTGFKLKFENSKIFHWIQLLNNLNFIIQKDSSSIANLPEGFFAPLLKMYIRNHHTEPMDIEFEVFELTNTELILFYTLTHGCVKTYSKLREKISEFVKVSVSSTPSFPLSFPIIINPYRCLTTLQAIMVSHFCS